MMYNYYKLLGVNSGASLKEIRMAYKREASKWHPDRNSSNDATERMQLINEARLILTDDEARARYDREFEIYESIKLSKPVNDFKFEADYVFNDDVLFNWIRNAREQSKELAKASLEDLIGITYVGISAFYNKTKYAILLYVFLLIVFLVFS